MESFLDSHSREKCVYSKRNVYPLLLKVKRHVACKGINDIQIRKSTFALDKPEALKSLYRSPGNKLCPASSWNYDQHKKHKVCKGPSND